MWVNCEVGQILFEKERAVGVLVHGKKLYAKHIIANCSPSTVMGRMLPEYVKPPVKSVKVWDDNCKSFTFIPDPERGTEQLAFFKAGSYLSVFLDVNGMKLTRPTAAAVSAAGATRCCSPVRYTAPGIWSIAAKPILTLATSTPAAPSR